MVGVEFDGRGESEGGSVAIVGGGKLAGGDSDNGDWILGELQCDMDSDELDSLFELLGEWDAIISSD